MIFRCQTLPPRYTLAGECLVQLGDGFPRLGPGRSQWDEKLDRNALEVSGGVTLYSSAGSVRH
jgi:hypothetical protein